MLLSTKTLRNFVSNIFINSFLTADMSEAIRCLIQDGLPSNHVSNLRRYHTELWRETGTDREGSFESLWILSHEKFSTNQVRECIGPLNGQRKSVITRLVAGSATTVVYLSVLVAITAALWKWPTANKILTANAKILSVKVSWRLGFKRKHFLKQLHHITYIKKCMVECILA